MVFAWTPGVPASYRRSRPMADLHIFHQDVYLYIIYHRPVADQLLFVLYFITMVTPREHFAEATRNTKIIVNIK